MIRKYISFVLFLIILTIALFSGCNTDETITLDDREYKKVVHEFYSEGLVFNIENTKPHRFPEITGYDDVVVYGKQLFYSIYGYEQDIPYTVCYNKDYDCWVYQCETRRGAEKYIDSDFMLMAFISGSGELLGVVPSLPEDYVIKDVSWDTSNAFTFNYDDLKNYTDQNTKVYHEKLEKITCAEDVLDRALYLYDKWNLPNNGNPYYICYDEVNDCWLYYDFVSTEYCATLDMVIHSSGEILLAYFVYDVVFD